MGAFLPSELQLVKDPFGVVLGGGRMRIGRWLAVHARPLWLRSISVPTPLGSRMFMVRLLFVMHFMRKHGWRRGQINPAPSAG